MGLLVVGVQGHQKTLENSKTLKKIDVFACLVVQAPGVPPGWFTGKGGLALSRFSVRVVRPTAG